MPVYFMLIGRKAGKKCFELGRFNLYNVCAVPLGAFGTMGGYLEYRGGRSVLWEIV